MHQRAFFSREKFTIVNITKVDVMDSETFQIIYTRLTQTQKKVVDLLLNGGDDHHIGESLGMAKATVRRHISNICQVFADTTSLPINRTTLASYSRFFPQLNFLQTAKNKIIGDIPSVVKLFWTHN
ncbi:MAG: hypothetical protein HC908_12180 [Calothrix sp. SM1_7_51]|nr:hypothetical protein [Calothrix sp. SM1_7_51]